MPSIRMLGVLCVCTLVAGCGSKREAPGDSGVSPDAGNDAGAMMCEATEQTCGTTCCGSAEICADNEACCARDRLCGSSCCAADQACEGAVCVLDCASRVGCVADDGTEACCAADEVCANGACFLPETECEDFIDCPAGQYCEMALGRCLPQPDGDECVSRPTGGDVTPTLLWHWDGTGAVEPEFNQVIMAPMVANLTDDNGDGRLDEEDVPDVVFHTYRGFRLQWDGILRAVSGDDGSPIFDVTDPALRTIPGSQVAIGDIDGDLLPEIVACQGDTAGGTGPLIAFEHDGTFKWRSSDARVFCGSAGPGIADFDADGNVEVFVRYSVVDGRDGSIVWHQDCDPTWREREHNPCEYTTAADLDGDGQLELVGGNVAYGPDGSVHYDHRADFSDGYPAVGDLDLDGSPEVVTVHSSFGVGGGPAYQGDHWLRVLDADGTVRVGPIDVNVGLAPPADVAANQVAGGGPPTIANVDSDPEPEIALAGAYAYVVFDADGTPLWTHPTNDFSSRKTGSSIFDFDGDGVAEVVYNDQFWLRVFDGMDGEVRFCLCNTSATLWEYPVIVDVNNDGHAEIVLASNATDATDCAGTPALSTCESARIASGETAATDGIRVFASPTRDWVATRRIWNQHSYHITNISESASVPRVETPNWSVPALNNFRQNLQPGATNVADLVPVDLSAELDGCPTMLGLAFRIRNDGWAASPPGVPVAVYLEAPGGGFERVADVMTSRALLPGESETFIVPASIVGYEPTADIAFRVVVRDGAGGEEILDCRPENDSAMASVSCNLLI